MPKDHQQSLTQIVKSILYFGSLLVIAVAGVYVIDLILLGKVWSGKSRPTFDRIFYIRTVFIFIFSVGFFYSFLVLNPTTTSKIKSKELKNSSETWAWISLSRAKRRIGIGAVILFSTFFLYVFYHDADLFRDISSDQKFVENMSALFAIVASVIFFISGFKLNKIKEGFSEYYKIIAWLFSALFLIIFMEETAWTQGIFFFDTPELFKNNGQGEMNIHNYATSRFEWAYYFSTFLFFIIFPFFYEHRSTLERIPIISFFIPSRLMIYIGAMALAYNYDMWNDLLVQFSFFITLLILGYYAWFDKADHHQIILTVLIGVYFLSQISFLTMGFQVTRTPAFKEYKEFFIPMTFFFYSLEILLRTNILKKGRCSSNH